MLDPGSNNELPPIPAKRYFTIGEVSDLCLVKPHVLRYWEQEFPNLKPVKRRGNRRYYQRHDVLVIRQIRTLLYDEGFTIGGARQRIEGDAMRESTKPEALKVDAADARIESIRSLRLELEGVLELLKA
jgi:DNA-binding transcriptional MerR regulator